MAPQLIQRLKYVKYGLIALSIALFITVTPLWGQAPSQLPSPEEAAHQAEQLSPEQLIEVQIDEVTRDRLRFDPAWQPIMRSVQQDLMILKWGDNQLENPAWQQYGAKAYPLLDYYARSNDATRQVYGVVGIRSLGKPYTTLWLEKQLQRKGTGPDFYLLTGNPVLLIDPNVDAPHEVDWQKEFGLDDAATRDRLIAIAKANLEPRDSATYYNQFNLAFIESLLGYEATQPPPLSEPPSPAQDPALGEWNQLEALTELTDAQKQQAIALYRSLNPLTRDYLLVTHLGRVKAGEISPAGKALLQALATDAESSDRVWAIAELDRHSDPEGSAMLQQILNTDLAALHPLTKWAGYGEGFYLDTPVDRGTQAYYLLIGIAEKYPQSRFVRAARDYGNLTGRSYFGGVPRSQIILDRIAQQTPQQRTESWQTWLDRYPDHPGADDATYFLARSLQDQNQLLAALDLWIRMMVEPMGDKDAAYLAYPHVRTLLDIGLSTEQLEELVNQDSDAAVRPLFQYALAVRYAREQNYTQALNITNGLDLTTMPEQPLDSYYSSRVYGGWYRDSYSGAQIQKTMQDMLGEQRQRWQRLQQLQADNTAAARYELASDWAGEGGWKNGYLPVWEEARTFLLPTGDWGDYYCNIFWVCNSELRGVDAVQASYQQASQNAIALKLYADLLNMPDISAALREKTLFMMAYTLLAQWEDYPLGETFRIHAPAGVTSTVQAPKPAEESYEQWQATYDQIQQDYLRAIDGVISALEAEFPQSNYIDDLLFSRYAMSGEPQYLQQLVERYPQGDRAAEAQFLLVHRSS